MRWSGIALLGALTLQLSISPAVAAQGGPAISERVRAGNMDSTSVAAKGTSVEWGRATALVNAPAADVVKVVQDYGGYKGFLPNFEESRVLSQRGASALIYVRVSVLHGASKIWAELKARPEKTETTTRIINVKMTKGNVKHFGARWEVTPVSANQSLVTFQLLVDPDLPVPSGIVSKENRKSARKTIRALRKLLVARGMATPMQPAKKG